MPEQRPWYFRSTAIVASLILFAPAGVALLWLGATWSRRTKVIASLVALAWFGYVAGKRGTDRGEMARAPAIASSASAPKPSANRAPAASLDAGATADVGPRVEEINAKPVADEPRLLLPVRLKGHRTLRASRVKEGIGASAQYESTDPPGLLTFLCHDIHEGALPTPEKNEKLIKLGDHDALLIDEPAASRATVLWRTGAWALSVEVRNIKPGLHAAALKLAPRVAEESAAWADMWLGGGPVPDAPMRTAHLLALENANKAAKEADEASQLAFETQRKQEALDDFVKTLERGGISRTTILRVDLNRVDANTLDVTVSGNWQAQSKQDRLRAAQALWNLWAQRNTPLDLDKSFIKLIDSAGNKVGGSGVAGSSVSVR